MKRITSTAEKLYSPIMKVRKLLTTIAISIFFSATFSSAMTFKSIEAGIYNDCDIWTDFCAPDRILFEDTVVISHDIELTNDLIVEGVLIIEKNGFFYGSYSVNVAESGVIMNAGVIELEMEVQPVYFVPNSFSPNGDEYNNTFSPVFVSGYELNDYKLTVYNGNGKVIFESNDANMGWDGSYKENGIVQSGVYMWEIKFKETMSAKRHLISGHVNVVL